MLSLPRGWGEASSTRGSARRGRPAKVGLRNKIGTPMAREDKDKEVKREMKASRSEGQALADAADAAAAGMLVGVHRPTLIDVSTYTCPCLCGCQSLRRPAPIPP